MEDEVHFGPFVLRAARRTLTRNGDPVVLGSRAMDILVFLVANAGRLLTNAEIIKHAWPDTFVDETNLRVHISAIRRTLGDTKKESQFLTNTPGRGYTFIAEAVHRPATKPSQTAEKPATVQADGRSQSRIFGRGAVVETLSDQLTKSRLLTIVGPGGIGKSTVARSVIGRSGLEVVWVDLAQLTAGELLSTEVASRLDILSRSDDINLEIAAAINGRDVVIVLDSCEHLVDEVAVFVETILDSTDMPRFLATSREPLRAAGEWVHRLTPLDLPEGGVSASEAVASPAVQLFVERAAACRGGYELTEEDAPHVAEICRQLDGIALAIELAAARMDRMSAMALAASLEDRFRVLTRGRRTALVRHQTLRAALDWSYLVLPPEEQEALQRLSILRGWFRSGVAAAVVDGFDPEGVVDNLVSKSLVVVEPLSRQSRFRLLDTTRFYAADKLRESGGTQAAMERLTGFLSGVFAGREQELYTSAMEEWSDDFAQHVPSIRIALEWAFASDGNTLSGVRLTVAALPLFFRLSLLDECLVFVTKAIAYLDARPGLDERSRMKLYAALGWPQMRSTDAPQKGIDAWSTALLIAENLGDIDYQLRAVWALWVDAINRAEPLLGLEFAQKFQARAAGSPDPMDAVVGKRIMGATLHWLGRHAEARDLLEQMIRDYDALPSTTRFQFDQRATARIILARCHWILGEGERALAEVRDVVDYTLAIGHELSLTNVLAEAACPIALLEGRLDLAKEYIAVLAEHTKSLSLDVWSAYARCFEAEVALREGRAQDCLDRLRSNLTVLNGAGFVLFRTAFQAVEAQALGVLCLFREAHAVIDAALADCQSSGERWCRPELLRVKGLLVLQEGGSDAIPTANRFFEAGLEAARADGAIAWERRIAPDLTRLLKVYEPARGDALGDVDRIETDDRSDRSAVH